MTTSDKTGEKLVESVRRTKTAAAAVEPAAPPKRTSSRAGKNAAVAAEEAPVQEPAPAGSGRRDHYASVGRVWPD